MEWVETTAKTLDEAREAALDRLGVAADEAEFEIIEEPRPGLFGRVRGEARLRARVRPTPVRPKQERRRRRSEAPASATAAAPARDDRRDDASDVADRTSAPPETAPPQPKASSRRRPDPQESTMEATPSTVTPDEVAAAAAAFMEGLTTAFGTSGTVAVRVEDQEIDVTVEGSELGLLVGPGGRTLNAIQDLARVAAQRRLGDHETRLRVDVAGYRERREAALAQFARSVTEQVRATGVPRSLEPMTSTDRKVVHDVVAEEDGVTSRSIGDDPDRRIIIEPA